MVDLILNLVKKLIEVVVVVTIIVGLFNFVRTPGKFIDKLKGSYAITASQGGEVVHAGKDLFADRSDRMVRNIGKGILKATKDRESGQLIEINRSEILVKE